MQQEKKGEGVGEKEGREVGEGRWEGGQRGKERQRQRDRERDRVRDRERERERESPVLFLQVLAISAQQHMTRQRFALRNKDSLAKKMGKLAQKGAATKADAKAKAQPSDKGGKGAAPQAEVEAKTEAEQLAKQRAEELQKKQEHDLLAAAKAAKGSEAEPGTGEQGPKLTLADADAELRLAKESEASPGFLGDGQTVAFQHPDDPDVRVLPVPAASTDRVEDTVKIVQPKKKAKTEVKPSLGSSWVDESPAKAEPPAESADAIEPSAVEIPEQALPGNDEVLGICSACKLNVTKAQPHYVTNAKKKVRDGTVKQFTYHTHTICKQMDNGLRKLLGGSVEHKEVWNDLSKTEQLDWWEQNSGLSLYGQTTALNVLLEHRQEEMFRREVNKNRTPMSRTMLDTAVKDGKMSTQEVESIIKNCDNYEDKERGVTFWVVSDYKITESNVFTKLTVKGRKANQEESKKGKKAPKIEAPPEDGAAEGAAEGGSAPKGGRKTGSAVKLLSESGRVACEKAEKILKEAMFSWDQEMADFDPRDGGLDADVPERVLVDTRAIYEECVEHSALVAGILANGSWPAGVAQAAVVKKAKENVDKLNAKLDKVRQFRSD